MEPWGANYSVISTHTMIFQKFESSKLLGYTVAYQYYVSPYTVKTV